jgi:hypothetical protein
MEDAIYARSGAAIGFHDGNTIYDWQGQPVGQLRGSRVYCMGGHYVGELKNGIMLGKNFNRCNISSHKNPRGGARANARRLSRGSLKNPG